MLKTFKDKNNFKEKKIAKPQLPSKDLQSMVDLLPSRIFHPWLCKTSFTKLRTAIVYLLDSKINITQHMKTNIVKSCQVQQMIVK